MIVYGDEVGGANGDKLVQMYGHYHNGDVDAAGSAWSGDPVQVADRTWFVSLFAGVTAFDTDEGVVLVDTGLKALAPVIADQMRQHIHNSVHTAVYTHGHVDHAYGLGSFLLDSQSPPVVVGHRSMPKRFSRYSITSGYNLAINFRQFGGSVPAEKSLGQIIEFDLPEYPPTVLYDNDMKLEVGGVHFELYHAMGETDDATWVWCPDRGVLCPGDLFIWAVPNCGNPQKVQRFPWEAASALRKMAALEPDSLCPGHGGPVVYDSKKIKRMLTETASYLECIVEKTLDVLNSGAPPHVDILHEVDIPVVDSPWLRPMYDDPEFIIHNIIRYYGGWWNGRPSDLKPASRGTVASELAVMCGGAKALAERSEQLMEEGEVRLACHLADLALEADAGDETVQQIVASVYTKRAGMESSLMATNIFLAAADYARSGRPYR